MSMHDDEITAGPELLTRLVAEQFPRFAGLPLRPLSSTGTVNVIYRLGDDLCLRLPRSPRWAGGLEQECRWLPVLAPRLSLAVPRPLELGRPTAECPVPWAIYRWLEGEPYADDRIADEPRAARELARFVAELQAVEPVVEAPGAGRRPLGELDGPTRAAIGAGRDLIDAVGGLAAWESALAAPGWSGDPVWIHADLLRPNLLVEGGRLSAVLDFGSAGVGDPAADLIAAWSVFGPAGRATFRQALAVDDGTWARARGYALHQAALIISYYRTSNPAFAAPAVRTVEQVLLDVAENG